MLAVFEADCVEWDMTPIKRDDFVIVCLMWDSALACSMVAVLLENGVAELSLFWRMKNRLLLKVRLDWLGEAVLFTLEAKEPKKTRSDRLKIRLLNTSRCHFNLRLRSSPLMTLLMSKVTGR